MISNPSNSLEWMVFLAQKYSSMFIKGTWLTLYISVVGTLLGFVLGYIVGIVNDVKLNDGDNIVKKVLIRIVKVIFTVYVEVFRDTPMIVQAMIVYYGIRQMGYHHIGNGPQLQKADILLQADMKECRAFHVFNVHRRTVHKGRHCRVQ